MSGTSQINRHEPFIAVAILTAHQVNLHKGFRLSETKRYMDRWMYWRNLIEDRGALRIQNTQISRYLNSLVKEGYATKTVTGKYPFYRLTRPGLLEILSRLVSHKYYERREHFFFVYMIIKTYRQQLTKLVQIEGKYFPQALQDQIDSLLDADLLLNDHINHVRRELGKLENKLKDQRETLNMAAKFFREGKSLSQTLSELDKQFAKALNPLRRYSVLDEEGTHKQRAWELTQGSASRLGYLWLPAQRMLQHYLDELLALKQDGGKFVAEMTASFSA